MDVFSQGVSIQSSQVWSLNAIMLPAFWKPSAKALWQVVWSIWMPAVLRLAIQNLQIPEHAKNRTLPSWLFNACLSARDKLTLVALMPFWSLPYLLKNTNRPTLLICTRCLALDNTAEMYTEFRSSMSTRGRYTSLRLNTVKIYLRYVPDLDTN